MLSWTDVSKTFGRVRGRVPFADLRLDLRAAEYFAIMGHSGVGKSTLLNLMAGLDTADSCSVEMDGSVLAGMDDDALTRLPREKLGFVLRAFHVLPYLDVASNVEIPLPLLDVPHAEEKTVSRASSMQ